MPLDITQTAAAFFPLKGGMDLTNQEEILGGEKESDIVFLQWWEEKEA